MILAMQETTMPNLDEKIMRFETYVRELAQDREDFYKEKIDLRLDARVAKTWVWQLDQVTAFLTGMLDDWKEVSGERDKHSPGDAENGIEKGKRGTRSIPNDQGSSDDQ